ncbi:hypothetical protein [Streptomyces sp. NPDC127190]|uniref:hypothetical protein n=1 Tax=unclassified Streptomyces TaxID=2593676 RepID=UPI00364397FA
MNRPDGDATRDPRSTSRFALDRAPSIFAGTSGRSSRATSSFVNTPSPSLGSAWTSSTIGRGRGIRLPGRHGQGISE